MQHDSRAYLHDALTASENILQFVEDISFDEYCGNLVLRSAVERQFEIIGEAFSRIARHDVGMASQITSLRDIIDFRNFIAHGYDVIDNAIVWDIINKHLPAMIQDCNMLLNQ